MLQLNLIKVKLIGRMSLGLDTLLDLHVDRQQGGRHGDPTTVHYLAPGTWHTDKVVSRILIEPYLLVEEVDGSNQLQNSKEVPNLDP